MATCLALVACSDILGEGTGQDNGLPAATLAGGAVNLVPPTGYCVDKRSVRAQFALMARCDTLGGTVTFGAPLAVITVATVDQQASTAATSQDDSETILSRRSLNGVTLLEITGTPPSPDMRPVYWRAIGRVGDQVIGLAIYEGENGAPLGERAPQLLAETIQRTRARTDTQDNSATTSAKP